MRNALIQKIESRFLRTDLPQLTPGQTVRVHSKIKEGEKERVQVFEGVVIAKKNAGARSVFIVRKISYGVGVERIFPFHSPRIEKVEILSTSTPRRAKLFYLRGLEGKAARLREDDRVDAPAKA